MKLVPAVHDDYDDEDDGPVDCPTCGADGFYGHCICDQPGDEHWVDIDDPDFNDREASDE